MAPLFLKATYVFDRTCLAIVGDTLETSIWIPPDHKTRSQPPCLLNPVPRLDCQLTLRYCAYAPLLFFVIITSSLSNHTQQGKGRIGLPDDSGQATLPISAQGPSRLRWANAGVLLMAWLSAVNCRVPLVAIGPLLPIMIQDFHLSPTIAGSLTALVLVVIAALSIPGGVMVDRFGPRRVLIFSQVAITVVGALRVLAQTPFELILLEAGLGGGIGLAQPALAKLASNLASMTGTVATAVYVNGIVLGGLLAGAITAPFLLPLAGSSSWRGVLVMWSAVGVVASLGWLCVKVPNTARLKTAPFTLADFQRIMRIPGFWPISIAFAAQNALFYGLVTWLPTYYVYLGWTLAAASVPVIMLSAASVAGGLLAPKLARWGGGFRQPLIWSAIAATVAQVGITVSPGAGVIWVSVIGAATAVALTLGMAAPLRLVSQEMVGAATGVLLTNGYLGAVIGPLGIGAARNVTGGYGTALLLLAVIGVFFIWGSWRTPSIHAG